MRKLKLLLVLCALLGAGTAWAQTDVTSTYLTNPSFELGTDGTPAASAASGCYDAPYGWTVEGIAGGTRNFGIFNAQGGTPSAFGTQVTPASGDYYYLARNSWGEHLVVTFSQTSTLPAGIYSLDVAYKIATRDAASKGTLQLKAIQGGTETKVVSPVSANESSDTYFNTAGWTRLAVPFTVSESGEVTLQIYMDFNPGGGNPQQEAIIIDDVRLYNLDLATEANPADVTGWLVNHSFELDTYTGKKADGSTASSGILNYPTGWSFMLKTEGWNNCVNITDAPSHGNLARETWAGIINEVKVFQTLKNLPVGIYEISADARTNDGGANDICTYGTVDGKTVYSTPWDQSKMAGTWNGIDNWQTLTARFVLDHVGDAEVGLHSTHFMQFDNFRLKYLGGLSLDDFKEEYSAALAEAQGYIQQGMFDADKTALQEVIDNNTLDLDDAGLTQEQLETATANLKAANAIAKPAAGRYAIYAQAKALTDGNTNVDLTSLVINAGFELGTMEGWTSVDGGGQANNTNFSKMSGDHFVERWNNGVALGNGSLTHDPLYLPKGIYTITAEAQNIEQYNGNAGGKGYFLCANEESAEIGVAGTYSTSVVLTDGQELTIKFLLDNCTGNWISCDNVTLTFVGEDFPAYTLVTGNMNAEIAAAQTAADEAFQANKTIANYNTLTAAIAAAQASKEAYDVAATAIANAKELQENQNFASAEAATTFAEAIAALETSFNNKTLDATADNIKNSMGTVVTGWHSAANSAAVVYMNNGFALNAYDAALYINTWSIEGEGDGSNFKVPFYEYFAGDGNALGANTWTGTLTGLENGLYQVSAWVRVRTMNGETAVADLTGITMDVNGGTAVDVTEGDQVGTSRFQLKEYTAEGLVKDGKLHLNFIIDAENNIHWLSFKNIKYTKVRDLNPEEMTATDEEIAALIATIPSGKMSDARKNAIDAAKESLLSSKSLADYNALETAIEAAAASVANYALIESGTISTDNAAGWAISTSKGRLACNTWSTEGDTDGSGMTTNFIEDWASAGNALGEGALYYDIDELNPGEYYKVTALVRAYNEAGGAVDGASFFVNNGTKSLDEVGVACTGRNGKYGNFTVVGQVDENGKLRFGLQLESTSVINWVAIKNVTIETATGKVPTAIALSEHSTTMGTGTQQTLTATITPEDADDKLVIWTSSDETVVAVADGVIKALKAGSATITAKAYADDNVTATTTITVADAPAPSFYSEIAAGEFYIVNAATGKFLGGANDWGTRASIIEHGIPFTAAVVNDGKYTLASQAYNGQKHFLDGTYIDAASTELYIVPVGDGKYSISTAEGSAFVTVLFNSTIVDNSAANASSTLAQWYFLSKNDRDKMLAAATAENPADATYYINDANFGRNYKNGWTGTFTRGGNNENQNAMVQNAAADVYQTIENIPNGTYTLTVQSVTSGSAKFYANDVEQDIETKDDVTSQAIASQAFGAGYFKRSLTVTVTDRTLKIGVKSDDTDKVLYFDNFELFMTGYTPVTGVTADIDNAEIEIAGTATITAATNPANASFNALTYTSNNEEVATVDETGLVTAIATGEATITIAANEMESFSTTIDVTVVAPAIAPETVELNEAEVELTAASNTTTLTANVLPAGAPQTVVWTSSDEEIATVAEGVVTGVKPGTVTIRATAYGYDDIFAEATVTVTYPESTVPATIFANEGATRKVYTLGENLIKNGSFEYPNAVYGWTTGTGSVNAMSTSNFNVPTEGAADGNQYLQAKESKGGGDVKSINTSWPLEDGKTYVFGYKIKANKQCTTDLGYIGTSLSNTKGSENSNKKFDTPAYGTEWQDVTYTFTNTDNFKWLVFNARWMANAQSFDNFYLCEAAYSLQGNVDYATAAIPTANIGTGAFQYSQDAIDAANALVQGEATVEDVEAAYEALTTLNAPDADKIYNILVATPGHAKEANAVVIVPGTASANNPTGYGLNANLVPNVNLNQAVTFTKVSGNIYNISFETAEGTTYLTYGANNGSAAGWKNSQIQATTDADKKGEFRIAATATDNVINIYNTITNSTIACQNGGNIYTEAGNADFSVAETTKPEIAINTTSAGWGTVILPFAVTVTEIPDNVTIYSCVGVMEDGTLTFMVKDAIEANKPYLIKGAWNATLTGDAQGTALTYKYDDELLTGVYNEQLAPVGSYVLQKKADEDKPGFYKVVEDKQPTVKANRAYLTAPATVAARSVFYLEGNVATTIDAIQALTDGEATIYNAKGVQIPELQKGMNIIRMKDGRTQKVVVK